MAESDTPTPPKLLPDEIHRAVKPGTALLRLQTTHSREGVLDGAWWPRSRDVDAPTPWMTCELEVLRLHRETRLLVELPDRGFRDGLARFALADGKVPHALGELGVLAALEDDAPLVGREGGADRGDGPAGAVGGHALHEDQCLGPGGDGFVLHLRYGSLDMRLGIREFTKPSVSHCSASSAKIGSSSGRGTVSLLACCTPMAGVAS